MIPAYNEMRAAQEAKHGKELQSKISAASVAICGLGGLGSNIAVALTRTGVGHLTLIDFDRVEVSNLQRQQYKASQIGMFKTEALNENLHEINPYAAIDICTTFISPDNCASLLESSDIVCEAFDVPEYKAMLANCVLENMPDKYLVSSSGMAGLDTANNIKTRRVAERFYVCGDEKSDIADGTALFSARVMLCAAHQALTVIRIIANRFDV